MTKLNPPHSNKYKYVSSTLALCGDGEELIYPDIFKTRNNGSTLRQYIYIFNILGCFFQILSLFFFQVKICS